MVTTPCKVLFFKVVSNFLFRTYFYIMEQVRMLDLHFISSSFSSIFAFIFSFTFSLVWLLVSLDLALMAITSRQGFAGRCFSLLNP